MLPAVAGPRDAQADAGQPGVTAVGTLIASRHDPGRDDCLDLQLAAKQGMAMTGADLDEASMRGAKLGFSTPALPGLDREFRRLRHWCEKSHESEQQKYVRPMASAVPHTGGRR